MNPFGELVFFVDILVVMAAHTAPRRLDDDVVNRIGNACIRDARGYACGVNRKARYGK